MYYPPERRRDWSLFARGMAEQAAAEHELDDPEKAHLVAAWNRWATGNTIDLEPGDWDEYMTWLGRRARQRCVPLGIWSLIVALLVAVAPVGSDKMLPAVLILLGAMVLFGALAVSAVLQARRVEKYRRAVGRAYEILRREPATSFDSFCDQLGRSNIRHFVHHRGEQALRSYWLYYSEWQGPTLVEPVAA